MPNRPNKRIQLVEKNCKTCGQYIGFVYPQHKYCEECGKKRDQQSTKESEERRRAGKRANEEESAPPSPCYTTADGVERKCDLFFMCGKQNLACRAYYEYVDATSGNTKSRAGTDYLHSERIPNAGFYHASFCDSTFERRRREAVRILGEMPKTFTVSQYVAVDSFLKPAHREMCLSIVEGAGLVQYVGGGKKFRPGGKYAFKHPRYEEATYVKLTDRWPERIDVFLRKDGASPTSAEGGSTDQTSPTVS